MYRRQIGSLLAFLILTALTALPTSAGQVRVNVSNNVFTPRTVNVDTGDHVVWIWTGGSHSVTSGDSASGSPSGIFNSTTIGPTSTFSFRTPAPQTIPYYCIPHLPFSMTGRVIVQAGGNANASDFRITEVFFAGGEDRVEIANLGASGDLAKYRLKVSGQPFALMQIGITTNIAVSAGSRIVLHFGTTGTNTTTNLFFPTLSLPDTGSVALYVPNTATPSLDLATQIIDFVQWGAIGQENEATANSAGYWAAGTSINGVAPGHSIEFCGTPGQYGVAFWSEVATPNFGSNGGCATPTVRSSWGRIKTLYR